MVLGMSTSVFAASITVNQDGTYSGTEGEAGRTFTYNQIFHATLSGANTSTGGGYDEDGTPGTVSASLAKGYSYFLDAEDDATQIGELGTWNAETKTWTRAEGNLWFDLTPSADGTQYVVSWAAEDTDTDTAQAAAKWLAENYTPLASDDLDFANGKWTATDLEDGYYLLSSDTGDNLIAATGDININEKNDYPPITKEQTDEDLADQPITEVEDVGELEGHTEDDVNVAIGDVVAYKVTVTIPAAAKVGETIEVWDKNSEGLTYNNDLVFDPDTNVEETTAGTGECWHAVITVTADNKGTDVVFEYSMTINEDALVDVDRQNEAGLKYGDNYESLPHSVKYKTYFTGIEKIDGETEEPLEGVKFTLTEDGEAFNVTLTDDGYYIPGGDSNEVETNEDGLIIIRGLDDDKEYVLTETETQTGYNLLSEPKTLTLVEDTADTYATDNFDQVENNKGTVLPSTGGIGTTIFYVIGAILVIGAGVVLVTRRRMNVQ